MLKSATHIACCILLACVSLKANAQWENWLNKTYSQRHPLIFELHAKLYSQQDTIALKQTLQSLRDFAERHDSKDLACEANLTEAYFYTLNPHVKKTFVLAQIQALQQQAKDLNDPIFKARLASVAGNYYWDSLHHYEMAFEQLIQVVEIQKKLTVEQYPDYSFNLYRLGECYYFFHDYGNAIRYLQELADLKTAPIGTYLSYQTNNTLGLCYQHLNQLDSSDYYFKRIYADASQRNKADWVGVAGGNLGLNQIQRGNDEAAWPLLEKDVEESIKRQDWGSAGGGQISLANICLRKNNMAEATTRMLQARAFVYRSGDYDRLRNLYPLMSKLYSAQGNYPLAAVFFDSAFMVKDSVTRKYNALQLLRAQQKSDLQKHRAEIDNIENQKKIKVLERNILLALVVLVFLTSLYIYQLQKRSNEQKRLLLNAQLKDAEHQLAIASTQLQDFAKSVTEKTRLLENIQEQLGNTDKAMALELQQKTILTDEDWEYFRHLFEQVHSGYLARLKEKLPGLTPAETRFMALAKMQLSNKEMAAALGVSTQAIRTTWYRLRKKLNLPEEHSLDEIVLSVDR